MNVLLPISCSLLLLASCSSGKRNNNGTDCNELVECVGLASDLTGQQYIFKKGMLKGEINSIGNVKWTKDNAGFLIGEILANADYARLKVPGSDIYRIIEAKDIRYAGQIPTFSATNDSGDTLPPANSADFAELTYQVRQGRPGEIARNLRPFISKYGRVVDVASSGIVIVRDNLNNLHAILPLIRKMDVPPKKGSGGSGEEMNFEKARELFDHMKGFLEQTQKSR